MLALLLLPKPIGAAPRTHLARLLHQFGRIRFFLCRFSFGFVCLYIFRPGFGQIIRLLLVLIGPACDTVTRLFVVRVTHLIEKMGQIRLVHFYIQIL